MFTSQKEFVKTLKNIIFENREIFHSLSSFIRFYDNIEQNEAKYKRSIFILILLTKNGKKIKSDNNLLLFDIHQIHRNTISNDKVNYQQQKQRH